VPEAVVNSLRVPSVFAGRTARPKQAAILGALTLSRTAEITEIRIRPERNPPPG
jgi:hypothetical protein